jgi:SPP1 gp7 family putative phage head morphogenesis protein
VTLAQPREFEFATSPDKLDAFNRWFKGQVDNGLLGVDPKTHVSKPWTSKYVESAYKRGQVNAYLSTKQAKLLDELGVGSQTQEQFLRDSFSAPETVSKLRLLGTRTYEQLKGISSKMSSDMSRILAQGLADGSNPNRIAKTMSDEIDKISRSRATTIARTEIIHAHAEGQLDAFDELGVKKLGVVAEWSTAGDDRVCPDCQEREGNLYALDEARGLIPLHPNCRCTWVPAPPTDSTTRKIILTR